MRKGAVRAALFCVTLTVVILASVSPANAFHFYRSTDGGCSPVDGAQTDDPVNTIPHVTATVVLGHNTFSAGLAGSGFDPQALLSPTETRIKAGDSITWTWNSSHCHSVTSADFASETKRVFDSGFHYPTAAPESTRVAPGLFEYPVLDETPTLSFTHTFATPGTYSYSCVHHTSIGMNGVVIVEA